MRCTAVFLLALVVCFCLPAYAEEGVFPPSSTPVISGIDVSAWQGEIDWQQVYQSGVEIAIIRSSEGSSVIDSQFERNYTGAKAAGVAVGFYHFMTASTPEEARAQADFFLRVIDGKTPECLLALDVGADGSLSGEQLTAIALAFLERVESQSGLRAMLYTDAYAARARFGAELARYPIWVANYGVRQPEANGKWASWVGFQYGDSGRIPGIDSRVDLDYFTREVYQDSAPTPAPTAIPTLLPTPVPTTVPTCAPTATPTCVPTPTPTCVPTPVPTPVPTATPTFIPIPTPIPCPTNGALQCILLDSAQTVTALARQLMVSEEELLSLNTLEEGVALAGQLIRYPGPLEAAKSFAGLHILQPCESLYTLARRYHTTATALAQLNGLGDAFQPVGQVIKVPSVGNHNATVPSWVTEHSVMTRKGDTLACIAVQYGMLEEQLAAINGLYPGQEIFPGQLLRLAPYGNGSRGVFRGGYVVQRGDNLDKIAERFEVTLDALFLYNNIEYKSRIYPGMILMIPPFGD